MSDKTKRITIRLTQEEYNIILLLSKKTYYPTISSFIRMIIQKFIEEIK